MTQSNLEAEQPQHPDTELRLPRAPGVFRRWLASHPRAVDWIIVGTYLFGCLMMLAIEIIGALLMDTVSDIDPVAAEQMSVGVQHLTWPWVLVTLFAIAGPAVALRFRRRYPVQGVILLVVIAYFDQGFIAFPNTIALLFLIYAVPVFRSVAAGWVAYAIAVASFSLLFSLGRDTGSGLFGPGGLAPETGATGTDAVMISILNALMLLAVLMIGINMGNRRRYVDALIDRARQLVREREQQAQLAAAGERARIAREMHDIVAHSLSVVVTLSEAATVTIDQRPEAAKQAMERAAETGRDALAEMRRLLGVLRDPEATDAPDTPDAPQPDAAQLPQLMDGFREAGLDIDFTEHGVPAGDNGHQLNVYRITQEALTNALRYAGSGASVVVTLGHSPHRTEITVTDSGPQRSGDPAGRGALTGSGLGIAGARQRAQVFGGTVEAGAYGAGWRLSAVVPTTTGERA